MKITKIDPILHSELFNHYCANVTIKSRLVKVGEQEYFITCNESDINIQPFNLGLYFFYSSKITKGVMEAFKV